VDWVRHTSSLCVHCDRDMDIWDIGPESRSRGVCGPCINKQEGD